MCTPSEKKLPGLHQVPWEEWTQNKVKIYRSKRKEGGREGGGEGKGGRGEDCVYLFRSQ